MKFNTIVGNPPFASMSGSEADTAWASFVERGLSLLTDNGYLGMITPNKWCGHSINVRSDKIRLWKDRFKHKLLYANIQECSRYFPGVGAYKDSFSYFVVDNSGSQRFTVRALDNTTTVTGDFEYMPLKCITDTTSDILKKTKTTQKWKFTVNSHAKEMERGKFQICIDLARHIPYKKRYVRHNNSTIEFKSSKVHLSKNSYPNSDQQKLEAIFYSKLYNFYNHIYWNNDTYMSAFYNNLPYLDPDVLWTDNAIYTHFNLTQEEIDYIERILVK